MIHPRSCRNTWFSIVSKYTRKFVSVRRTFSLGDSLHEFGISWVDILASISCIPSHEGVWGSSSKAPPILNRDAPAFYPPISCGKRTYGPQNQRWMRLSLPGTEPRSTSPSLVALLSRFVSVTIETLACRVSLMLSADPFRPWTHSCAGQEMTHLSQYDTGALESFSTRACLNNER
jgi:hypothetical protein